MLFAGGSIAACFGYGRSAPAAFVQGLPLEYPLATQDHPPTPMSFCATRPGPSIPQALEEEVQSKEQLVNELQETNEKLRDMRRRIVKERFGRAAQAGLATMYVLIHMGASIWLASNFSASRLCPHWLFTLRRLKELERERQERARDADYVRQLEQDRDEAQRRAAEVETMAAEAITAALGQLGDVGPG